MNQKFQTTQPNPMAALFQKMKTRKADEEEVIAVQAVHAYMEAAYAIGRDVLKDRLTADAAVNLARFIYKIECDMFSENDDEEEDAGEEGEEDSESDDEASPEDEEMSDEEESDDEPGDAEDADGEVAE